MKSRDPLITFVASVPDDLADGSVVFLFDIAVIVFVGRAASGEFNAMDLTPLVNGLVDELTAGIGMNAF
ncbi:hypothetical protein FACS1894137_17350 [Spirochaetia bacterium]|nr:hypothetical protein FACS1894137_17350 [Spirochaetia bacterium]